MACQKPSGLLFYAMLFCLTVLLVSCFKGDVMPLQPTVHTPVTISPPPGQSAMTPFLYRGVFMATPGITIMGSAKIVADSGKQVVLLDSFSVSGGPDLKVYLAKEYPAVSFINLGSLQRNDGTQIYPVPVAVDYAQYKYVLVHCQQYNHLFGYAALH